MNTAHEFALHAMEVRSSIHCDRVNEGDMRNIENDQQKDKEYDEVESQSNFARVGSKRKSHVHAPCFLYRRGAPTGAVARNFAAVPTNWDY